MFKFQLLQVPAPLKWATPWGMLFLAFCGPVTLVFSQSLQDTRCLPPLESLYSLFPLCQEELVITKWLWQARDGPKCFLFIILLTTILNFLLYSSPGGQWGTKIQSLVATQLLDPGFKPSLCTSWALALNHFTLLFLLTSYILLTLIYPSWLQINLPYLGALSLVILTRLASSWYQNFFITLITNVRIYSLMYFSLSSASPLDRYKCNGKRDTSSFCLQLY